MKVFACFALVVSLAFATAAPAHAGLGTRFKNAFRRPSTAVAQTSARPFASKPQGERQGVRGWFGRNFDFLAAGTVGVTPVFVGAAAGGDAWVPGFFLGLLLAAGVFGGSAKAGR